MFKDALHRIKLPQQLDEIIARTNRYLEKTVLPSILNIPAFWI